MYHIDATFEMNRMIFTPNGAEGWLLTIHEGNHGKSSEPIPVTHQQVADILAINLHPDAEPEGHEAMYLRLEPLFRDIGDDLRPIP